MRRHMNRRLFSALATTTVLGVVVATLLVASPAQAATLSLNQVRVTSGSSADAASTCPTQGTPTPDAHCAGYDTSTAGTDQILRAGDVANVRFDFATDGADTGVVIVSTLPEVGGVPLAQWTTTPVNCAVGSGLSNSNRTLTCRIANPAGPVNGTVPASLRANTQVVDGATIDAVTTITSDSSSEVAASGDVTYTVSLGPRYDIDVTRTAWYNTLTQPFSYYSPDGVAGTAVPISTAVNNVLGGYAPLRGPVTWKVDVSAFPEGTRLLNWGNYGNGCGRQYGRSDVINPGYTSSWPSISNQVSPPTTNTFACDQPGGANGDVEVAWTNPPNPVTSTGLPVNMWVMLWVPNSALPEGNSTYPFTITDFAPVGVDGAPNAPATGGESTANNTRRSSTITSGDRASDAKPAVRDANPTSAFTGTAVSSVTRGQYFQTVEAYTNAGTLPQTGLQLCDQFDSTTHRLADYGTDPVAGSNQPEGTFAVATTRGSTTDVANPPPFRPAAGYNGTSNVAVDPDAYTVEFAAGDFETDTPTTTPQSFDAIRANGCGDADTATGWVSSPDDPRIAAYAASKGLSDPLDVVNRIRVTFTGTVQPGQSVGAKFRFTTRDTFRDATTQAGEVLRATTPLRDNASYTYDQIETPWASNRTLELPVAGSLGVRVSSSISASPTNVQAGDPDLGTTTYTVRPNVQTGEDTSGSTVVRIVDTLSPSMRYVTGSASIPPTVLPQADGSTVLLWDLGEVPTPPNSNQPLDAFTFQARADAFATAGNDANNVVAQAVAPSGTDIDDRLVSTCSGLSTVSLPPTANVPVATTTQTLGYGQRGPTCYGPRTTSALITIGSAFVSLAASKSALALEVQPDDVDGVAGAEVGWTLPYANRTANTFPGVDIVDVLPHNGDGRSPESDFGGTFRLASLTTDDRLSTTPNALPDSANGPFPDRTGTTFYYTSAPVDQLDDDPYGATNLAGGATQWCLTTEFGTAGCPATIGDSTAFRVISGVLAPSQQHTLRMGFATDGNSAGDLYSNGATARIISLTSPVPIVGDTLSVVASSVAGVLWQDDDGDGVVQSDESTRIPGATVRLTGTDDRGAAVDRQAVTTANGTYSFPDLRQGSYVLSPDQATVRAVNSSYAVTYDPEHGVTDPTGSAAIDLGRAVDLTGQRFGFATQSIAGIVYEDDDDNGAQGPGEDGVGGATVHLRGTDDLGAAVDLTETSAADGSWTFADIRPGTYSVVVDPVDGLLTGIATPGSAGGDPGTIGDGSINDITIEPATNATGYLVGELAPQIIQATVFNDADADGAQGPDEQGIPNTLFRLTGTDTVGAVDRTSRSGPDGVVTFADLRDGTYTLTETQPSGYLDGTVATGSSVGTPGSNTVRDIVVNGENSTDGYTFAELEPSSIAGVVYDDTNGNGVRDAGEPAVGGATVTLTGTDDAGDVDDTFVTAADGTFSFTQLRPGTYQLEQTLPAGYLDGKERAGSAGGTVDNTAPGSRTIADIGLGTGTAATGYQFGDVRAASLAGSVFDDADGDGDRGDDEPGIPGVTITVTGTDDFGQPVSESTTTTATGAWTVEGLRPGSYAVSETQPAGYLDGAVTVGSAGGTAGTNTVTGIVLRSGVDATGYDFGERTISSLSGTVFADDDGDGVQGPGEDGIAGVTITLLDASGAPTTTTTTTNANGGWRFTGLLPGTYGVREAQPDGFFDGAVVLGNGGGTAGDDEVTGIAVDGDVTGYAFTEYAPSTIRGSVWHDSDDDGVLDDGEEGIAGVTVELAGPEARTTTTAEDGTFVFAALPAGTYTLTEQAPDAFAEGRAVVGSAGGTATSPTTITGIDVRADTDNSGYGFTGRTPAITLAVTTQTVDAPTAPGPYVPVGDDVRWVWTVGNPGETTLTGVSLVDSAIGDVVCPADTLAPGATMQCDAAGTATAGQYSSTAEVTALVAASSTARAIESVQSSATTHYFGSDSSYSTRITVNGKDATATPGPTFAAGTETTLAVTVSNTGNVDLDVTGIDAPAAGALVCDGPTVLAPGASVTCSVTWTPTSDTYAVPVTVRVDGPETTAADGTTSADPLPTDAVAYFVVAAEEPAEGGAPGGGPGPGVPGGGDGSIPPGLAFTGASITLALLLALGLTGTGIVLRRRRTHG